MKLKMQASQVESFGKALLSLGLEREELVVLDPDVSDSTKTAYFAERLPERFISVGISEQDMIGIAAGLAASGKTPVACGFAMFTSWGPTEASPQALTGPPTRPSGTSR